MVVPGLIFTNCTLFYQLFSLLERSIIFGSYKMSHISNFYAKYINIYPYYGSSAVDVLYFISMMVFQSFKLMSNKFKDNNIQVNCLDIQKCLSLTNNESVDIYMEMYFSNFIYIRKKKYQIKSYEKVCQILLINVKRNTMGISRMDDPETQEILGQDTEQR